MSHSFPPSSTIPPHYTGLILIKGQDSSIFLQNIISHDLNLLAERPVLHACLLTAQGKFLHDFYVTKIQDGYALNCESAARAEDLTKRLSLYRLRARITIENKTLSHSEADFADSEARFEQWNDRRIRLGLPNGSVDAEIGVSTLAELNLDQIAVSYTKGCYIGQELVARMHNRNLGKKHLVAVEFIDQPPPAFGTDLGEFGLMRSSQGQIGLILMSRDCEEQLQQGKLNHAPFRLLGL